MKKSVSAFMVSFALLGGFATQASAASCDRTAKGAAEDYMAQIMDEACAEAHATIVSKSQDHRANGQSRTIYDMDVVCGDASMPGNHHSHTVIVITNTCEVVVGGGGDA